MITRGKPNNANVLLSMKLLIYTQRKTNRNHFPVVVHGLFDIQLHNYYMFVQDRTAEVISFNAMFYNLPTYV